MNIIVFFASGFALAAKPVVAAREIDICPIRDFFKIIASRPFRMIIAPAVNRIIAVIIIDRFFTVFGFAFTAFAEGAIAIINTARFTGLAIGYLSAAALSFAAADAVSIAGHTITPITVSNRFKCFNFDLAFPGMPGHDHGSVPIPEQQRGAQSDTRSEEH